MNFFSVRFTTIIGGITYRPSICYPVKQNALEAINQLVKEGNAALYDREVRFVSGVAYPVSRHRREAVASYVTPVEKSTKRKDKSIQF